MRAAFIMMVSAAMFATVLMTGCQTDIGYDESSEDFVLGASYPQPSVTNRYGGLTVYKKKKGKIYSREYIIDCASKIDGFSIVEDDVEYKQFIASGNISNAWAYATVTNSGTAVRCQGSFEDSASWKSKVDDSFLNIYMDQTKIPPQVYTNMVESGNLVSVYRTDHFDEKVNGKYNRILSVVASGITDRESAINAFNSILSGLKAQ